MGYISKYNKTFINFVNNKYSRYKVCFKNWDDYALWLYYYLCNERNDMYYAILERDIWGYSDFQTGSAREQDKMNNNWKELEKDRFNLYVIKDIEQEYMNVR